MKSQEYILNKLKEIETHKRDKIILIKAEAKILDDEHSILRMKNHIDSWLELNFESEILFKIMY
jgi:hypothetical protein